MARKQDEDEDESLETDEYALVEASLPPISVEGILAASDPKAMAAAFDELRPALMARMVLRAARGKDKNACAAVYKLLASPLDVRVKAALLSAPNGAKGAVIEGQGNSVNGLLDKLLATGAKLPDSPEQGFRKLREIQNA